jgi:hypothetical protein
MRNIQTGVSLALVALVAACGSDSVTSPTFGSECNVGSIAPGQTKTGVFNASSCTMSYDFWSGDRVPYESRTVSLTKGKAYLFYEAQVPDPAQDSLNDVDAVLSLWGKNASGASVPLAVSDDDARGIDGHDSQIWFVAPESGTYQLVTASYWDAGWGGYRLEAHECPMLAKLDTAGTYNLTLPTSPCHRIAPNGTNSDTAGVAMITIPAVAGEGVSVVVTSTAFTPTFEMFGPGFDTYANIYGNTAWDSNAGTGSGVSFTMGEVDGTISLEIGSTTLDSLGAFHVALVRTPPAAPPVGSAPWSVARLSLSGMKPHPAKSR